MRSTQIPCPKGLRNLRSALLLTLEVAVVTRGSNATKIGVPSLDARFLTTSVTPILSSWWHAALVESRVNLHLVACSPQRSKIALHCPHLTGAKFFFGQNYFLGNNRQAVAWQILEYSSVGLRTHTAASQAVLALGAGGQ